MSNPFALLQDEGASDSEQPQVASQPAKSAPSSQPQPQQQQQQQQQQRKAIPGQAAAGGNPRGKPRDDYPGRGGARKVFNDKPANEGSAGGAGGAEGDPQKREGKGQRGDKAGRARGNYRTDRHSNTGRVDSDKQEHQGWGINDDGKRELADEQNGWDDAKADVSGVATPAGGDGFAASTGNTPVGADPWAADAADTSGGNSTRDPVVPDEVTKTYDEYLAERTNNVQLAEKLGLPSLAPRKANEGADDAQWKNAKAFARDEEEEAFAGNKETKGRKRPQKEGKTYIEVEARFPRPERAGGERGRGRGRGRGGDEGRGEFRPRGGARTSGGSDGPGRRDSPRNDRAQRPPVNMTDASAFPSLS